MPLSCSILAAALSLEVIEYEAFAEPVIDNSPAFAIEKEKAVRATNKAVSYTHLTLPTSDLV